MENASLKAVKAARVLLKDITPLRTDCGRFCGGACCEGDDETGMLLFPGEEALYGDCGFGEVLTADYTLAGRPALLFVCDGACEREARPLSCRLFPLLPAADPEKVRMDPRASGLCPLYASGIPGLAPAFVSAVKAACAVLSQDPACRAFLDAVGKSLTL